MKITMMNMVRILNKDTNEVVILDKIKKEGWEGLTFPGGKVDYYESFTDSVIREAKEESNLVIKNPKLVGIITWVNKEHKDIGLLYDTDNFSGELVKENREGMLCRKDYDEFKKMKNKSLSMDLILDIYDGKYNEIIRDMDENIVTFR